MDKSNLWLNVMDMAVELNTSYIKLEIPDDLIADDFREFDFHKHRKTEESGSKWTKSKWSSAIRVPSIIIPIEYNVILNPLHPDIGKVTIIETKEFNFDTGLRWI